MRSEKYLGEKRKNCKIELERWNNSFLDTLF